MKRTENWIVSIGALNEPPKFVSVVFERRSAYHLQGKRTSKEYHCFDMLSFSGYADRAFDDWESARQWIEEYLNEKV